MGEIILQSAMKSDPAAAKQLEIDKKDERNLAIANQAKAKAYDMMVFVFGALMLSFALVRYRFNSIAICFCLSAYPCI